jgi:hypothetical protein
LILNNNQVLSIPGVSPVVNTNRILNNNDTIIRRFRITLNITGTSGPITVPFCARLFAQNGNVTIDPDQNNNLSCSNVALPINEIAAAISEMCVYPNPAADKLNISFDYKHAEEVRVMDLSGKIMSTTAITSSETQIELNNYTTGIYLYQIIDTEGATIHTSKFSVSK